MDERPAPGTERRAARETVARHANGDADLALLLDMLDLPLSTGKRSGGGSGGGRRHRRPYVPVPDTDVPDTDVPDTGVRDTGRAAP
jgi:hypothetical protein